MTVDIDQFTVAGSSLINLDIVKETSYIIIHVKSMDILEFSVMQNGNNIETEDSFTYEENDFYIIHLSTSLSVGDAVLKMTYEYELGDDLVGFYRSSYKNASGVTHWIATTQFEPTDARKAFPCFDEPALKANFSISLAHSSDLNAHSNMPIANETTSGSMTTTLFQTSVKMSTYLVAFVVSNFECLTWQTDTVNRVNVSVVWREGKG